MPNFESAIQKNLSGGEQLMGHFSGRIAPTNMLLKIFSEVSWLTSSNMPIVLGITNKRLLIYKLHINSNIDLTETIDLKDVSTYKEANGVLNGGLLIQLRNDKKYKFVFKKETVARVQSIINSALGK